MCECLLFPYSVLRNNGEYLSVQRFLLRRTYWPNIQRANKVYAFDRTGFADLVHKISGDAPFDFFAFIDKKWDMFVSEYMRTHWTSLFRDRRKYPFGAKGALLYSPDGSMCVLRSRQPGQLIVRTVLRHFVPNKGLHPLRRLRVYPSALCGGNSLLMQTISVAKSENPMP